MRSTAVLGPDVDGGYKLLKRLASVLALTALVLGWGVPSAAAQRRPARAGSFVRYSVRSVDDLVNQIQNDPAVAKRYATHFGTSSEKLASYFRQNLTVVTLKSPVKVRTYFISKNGRIASKQRVLAAGRQVFATLAGDLLIETDCGNPVTRTLPAVKTKVKGTTEEVPPAPAPVEVLTPPAVTAGPETAEVFEEAAARSVEVAAEPLVEGVSAPSFLQIAEAVAPALAGLHYVQTRKAAPPPPPIPEPSSLVSLGLACSAVTSTRIALRRRRRMRK